MTHATHFLTATLNTTPPSPRPGCWRAPEQQARPTAPPLAPDQLPGRGDPCLSRLWTMEDDLWWGFSGPFLDAVCKTEAAGKSVCQAFLSARIPVCSVLLGRCDCDLHNPLGSLRESVNLGEGASKLQFRDW